MNEKPRAFIQLTQEQRFDWLRLIRCENVGSQTFFTLINHYGSARKALEVLPTLSVRGGAKRSLKIASVKETEMEMNKAHRLGVRFVALGEEDYPKLLRQISGPPPLLAVKGNISVFQQDCIGLVGSRNASALGMKLGAKFAKELGEVGFITISGLARGIDASVHRASLKTGTIAALAGGIDKPYPFEHEGLLEEIYETGAAISEMPLGLEPRAKDFPRRNRLIAGIARAVLVVEAAERSGSLITARLANEEGREVFAIPGSPLDPRSGGTNRLIRQGATLVTSAQDVLESLSGQQRETLPLFAHEEKQVSFNVEPQEDDRARLLSLITASPIEIDDLVNYAQMPAPLVNVVLMELILAGRISREGENVRLRFEE